MLQQGNGRAFDAAKDAGASRHHVPDLGRHGIAAQFFVVRSEDVRCVRCVNKLAQGAGKMGALKLNGYFERSPHRPFRDLQTRWREATLTTDYLLATPRLIDFKYFQPPRTT